MNLWQWKFHGSFDDFKILKSLTTLLKFGYGCYERNKVHYLSYMKRFHGFINFSSFLETRGE